MSRTFVAPLTVQFSAPVEQQAVRRGGVHQTQLSFTPPPVFQMAVRRSDYMMDLEEGGEE